MTWAAASLSTGRRLSLDPLEHVQACSQNVCWNSGRREMAKMVDEVLALWTKMVATDMAHDVEIENNLKGLQVNAFVHLQGALVIFQTKRLEDHSPGRDCSEPSLRRSSLSTSLYPDLLGTALIGARAFARIALPRGTFCQVSTAFSSSAASQAAHAWTCLRASHGAGAATGPGLS